MKRKPSYVFIDSLSLLSVWTDLEFLIYLVYVDVLQNVDDHAQKDGA